MFKTRNRTHLPAGMANDQQVGAMLLVAALAGFVYYTLWVIVTVRATHVRRRSASRAHQPATLGSSTVTNSGIATFSSRCTSTGITT